MGAVYRHAIFAGSASSYSGNGFDYRRLALFGPWKCFLFSMIGIVSGSLVAFIVGRKLGYKAVVWLVGEEDLKKWMEN